MSTANSRDSDGTAGLPEAAHPGGQSYSSGKQLQRSDGVRRRTERKVATQSAYLDSQDGATAKERPLSLPSSAWKRKGNDHFNGGSAGLVKPDTDGSQEAVHGNVAAATGEGQTWRPETEADKGPSKATPPCGQQDSDSDDDDWFDCYSELSEEESEESSGDSDYQDCTDSLADTAAQESPSPPPGEEGDEKRRRRVHRIVQELVTTEQAYVDRLGILCSVKDKVSRFLSHEAVKEIFKNVETIRQFHRENLLPQLQQRVDKWNADSKIGDIMKRFAPFLKLYTEYVENFERASELVDHWKTRSSEFGSLMKDVQEKDEYGRIRIEAHMLEPIQRVPRYELLLKDYIKHLPEGSDDLEDSEGALQLVAQAAKHFEDMMKRASRMEKLRHIQNRLDGDVNVVKPSRELIKEGRIGKVNVRSGGTSERYAFLFNDMLLVCAEQSITSRYRVRQCMQLQGMKVSEGNNLEVPNTFYVRTRERALELCTDSPQEKEAWLGTIKKVIGETTRNKLLRQGSRRIRQSAKSVRLGRQAPVFSRSANCVTCALCRSDFTTLRRKHHCRACGAVVCSKCSSQTFRLEYEHSKAMRVCDECFVVLQDMEASSGPDKDQQPRTRSGGMRGGYLHMSSDGGDHWRRCWFVVHNDGTLVAFQGSQSNDSQTSLQLHEFAIAMTTRTGCNSEVIQLRGQNKEYLFQGTDPDDIQSWYDTFQKARKDASLHRVLQHIDE